MHRITSFPLCWPLDVPFTEKRIRLNISRYQKLNMTQAKKFILKQFKNIPGPTMSIVVSTNVPVDNDGWYHHDNASDAYDKGAAVWWYQNKRLKVMYCDKYNRIEDNMYAIAKGLEAIIKCKRWINEKYLPDMFETFNYNGAFKPHWRHVFDNYQGNDIQTVKALYEQKLSEHGSKDIYLQAWTEAMKELR